MADAFCRWCGTPTDTHPAVTCRRELDPPRFCPECGRRMRVTVHTAGYEAACREHGTIESESTT